MERDLPVVRGFDHLTPTNFSRLQCSSQQKVHALIRVKGYILSHVEVIILPESLQNICAGCRIKIRTNGLLSYFMLHAASKIVFQGSFPDI